MYVWLYKEKNNKKENGESCVTVRYIFFGGVYDSNGFEVYKLWYAYVVSKCFTAEKKCIHI